MHLTNSEGGKTMKIVILGAGGMGSRFGLMLKKAGKDVTLLDGWDKNIEAIREHGIRANYNGEEVQVDIDIYPIDDFDPDLKADLLIVFTKAMQLEDAIQATRSIVTDQTKVLCLMNGIGYDDILRKYFDDEQIVLGNTMWTAGLEGPGRPKLFGNGYVNLLNLGKSEEAAAAAKDIVALLDEVGLNGVYEKEIFYLIYKKVCVNATMNGLCTILECNMADLGDAQASHDLINQLVKEVVDVANAEGVEMDLDEMIEHVGECFNRETIGGHFPSMYQDLITNKRLTEIDYINGAVAKKGKKLNVPTPYNQFLTSLVHTKEQLLGAK